ncbi:O-methyltransferase [Paenibacillus thermotolerans]|uniref:O-methyltransferase n=1 Tax=Paenibacillus thermotolerans TaxID=3027807 RepID=UPI002367A0D4|nr:MULTISPECIES: O-methyltransferase [unclassified Paenibacillus]
MSMDAEQYTESLLPSDAQLDKVLESIRANGMPEISVKPGYGRLLTLLVAASGAKRVLEIGALGGYSGICLARGLRDGGELISLELKQDFADLAYRNLSEAGFGSMVNYRVGEALDSLEALAQEGQRFDFFFIDADKGNYPNYLEWALRLGNPGAIIVGDNTLQNGRVMNEDAQSPSVVAMREFNERMTSDPRLDGLLLPAYDGLAIARIK